MRFQGKVYRDGRFWLAEVPIVEAITQGRTRKEALEMMSDWFETMVDQSGFSVTVHTVSAETFEVASSDIRAIVSLLLRRRREASGLSLAEAARLLGVKSRNAYGLVTRRGSPYPPSKNWIPYCAQSLTGATSWSQKARTD